MSVPATTTAVGSNEVVILICRDTDAVGRTDCAEMFVDTLRLARASDMVDKIEPGDVLAVDRFRLVGSEAVTETLDGRFDVEKARSVIAASVSTEATVDVGPTITSDGTNPVDTADRSVLILRPLKVVDRFAIVNASVAAGREESFEIGSVVVASDELFTTELASIET